MIYIHMIIPSHPLSIYAIRLSQMTNEMAYAYLAPWKGTQNKTRNIEIKSVGKIEENLRMDKSLHVE